MDVISADDYERELSDPVPGERDNDYILFRDQEDIPVHKGLYIEDVNELRTETWERTGQPAAFINLYGHQYVDDIQLHELEPTTGTNEIRHFYDELVYVLMGNGITTIKDQSFEWSAGSLFYIPANVPYKHVNATEDTTARLASNTYLPQLIMMLGEKAIFDNPYDPWDDTEVDGYYSADGSEESYYRRYGEDGPLAWNTNFIPDVRRFDKLDTWNRTGAMDVVFVPLPQSHQYAHISEIPQGQYKHAHRHTPGANIIVLEGEGYELIWEEGDQKVRIDWGPGSLFSPPANWYHQHFNVSSGKAKHLALHQPRYGSLDNHGFIFDAHHPRNMISYADEDPAIRELYEQELDENGLSFGMSEKFYTDPEFQF